MMKYGCPNHPQIQEKTYHPIDGQICPKCGKRIQLLEMVAK